jgi:4-cresol dehydrogenase (hydroxylating)
MDRFSQAMQRLRDALGAASVLTEPAQLRAYSDPYARPGRKPAAPVAAVLPDSVEQVQEIVRAANAFKLPLWPISRGKNNGYGGAAVRVPGCVVVDLSRMNRVLEVNEECAYVVVEPGVSFFDLYSHLEARNSRLMLSVPDLGWGSVVGNALEYGIGYTMMGDHHASQCGLEVVLANGELLRTGMGAMSGNPTWHVYKKCFGPTIDGLFAQSNFGIVTRMGLWLMPKPECYGSCHVICRRDADLGALIDTVRPGGHEKVGG